MTSAQRVQTYLFSKFGIRQEETEAEYSDAEFKTFLVWFGIPKYGVFLNWEEDEENGDAFCEEGIPPEKEIKRLLRESREFLKDSMQREKLAKQKYRELQQKYEALESFVRNSGYFKPENF
nr:hypothetical protein [Marseillevirus cajuinensis]